MTAPTTEIVLAPLLIEVPASNGRGKGRVKVRKKALAEPATTVLQLAPPSYREEAPLPRFPRWLLEGHVPAFNTSLPKEHNAAWELLRTGQPAAFVRSALVAALVERWSLSYLAEAFGKRRAAVDVLCSDERADAFLEHDSNKNVYGSFYHIREPSTRHLSMSFHDFAGCLTAWTSKKLLVRERVMSWRSAEAAAKPDIDIGLGLQQDLQQLVDWPWLQDAAQVHGWGAVAAVSLEVGSTDGLQPARYHGADRLLAQVRGRRRVLLMPPGHAHRGLYTFPVHHPYDRYAMPDLDTPDLAAWPKLGDVRGRSILLQPGDLLFVPAHWFSHVQDMDQAATALVFEFGFGLRLHSQDAMRLAISRLIEERVGLLEGIPNVRRWLRIIARDAEEGCIDVGTVAGYKRVVMCQEVRDEIETVLGREAVVSEVLLAMGDRRLIPTPWLNQGFREPLYLTDNPVLLLDDRTEEELKYPELFRHRVRQSAAPAVCQKLLKS